MTRVLPKEIEGVPGRFLRDDVRKWLKQGAYELADVRKRRGTLRQAV